MGSGVKVTERGGCGRKRATWVILLLVSELFCTLNVVVGTQNHTCDKTRWNQTHTHTHTGAQVKWDISVRWMDCMCLWFCKLLPLGEAGLYRGRVCHRGSTNVSNGSGNGPRVQPPQGNVATWTETLRRVYLSTPACDSGTQRATCGCPCSLTCLFRKQAAQPRSCTGASFSPLWAN